MTSSVQGVFFLRRDMCCRHLLDIHKVYLSNHSTMPEFTSDYAPCRDLLLKRLREPAPGRIQLLTGPRQVGKTTLLLEIAAKFGDAAVYLLGMKQTRRFPDFGSVVEPTPQSALAARPRFSYWMRFITWMTGQSNSKGIGTTCVERLFQSTSSQRAHPHCG